MLTGNPKAAEPCRTLCTPAEEMKSHDLKALAPDRRSIIFLVVYWSPQRLDADERNHSTNTCRHRNSRARASIHTLKTNIFDGLVFYLTHTHTCLKTTPAIRLLAHKHTHLLCMYNPLWLVLCVFANCRFFCTQPGVCFLCSLRNPPLNFQNPAAHTSGQLSSYVRVNISCSRKPLNYLFDTQVNALKETLWWR